MRVVTAFVMRVAVACVVVVGVRRVLCMVMRCVRRVIMPRGLARGRIPTRLVAFQPIEPNRCVIVLTLFGWAIETSYFLHC